MLRRIERRSRCKKPFKVTVPREFFPVIDKNYIAFSKIFLAAATNQLSLSGCYVYKFFTDFIYQEARLWIAARHCYYRPVDVFTGTNVAHSATYPTVFKWHSTGRIYNNH